MGCAAYLYPGFRKVYFVSKTLTSKHVWIVSPFKLWKRKLGRRRTPENFSSAQSSYRQNQTAVCSNPHAACLTHRMSHLSLVLQFGPEWKKFCFSAASSSAEASSVSPLSLRCWSSPRCRSLFLLPADTLPRERKAKHTKTNSVMAICNLSPFSCLLQNHKDPQAPLRKVHAENTHAFIVLVCFHNGWTEPKEIPQNSSENHLLP